MKLEDAKSRKGQEEREYTMRTATKAIKQAIDPGKMLCGM